MNLCVHKQFIDEYSWAPALTFDIETAAESLPAAQRYALPQQLQECLEILTAMLCSTSDQIAHSIYVNHHPKCLKGVSGWGCVSVTIAQHIVVAQLAGLHVHDAELEVHRTLLLLEQQQVLLDVGGEQLLRCFADIERGKVGEQLLDSGLLLGRTGKGDFLRALRKGKLLVVNWTVLVYVDADKSHHSRNWRLILRAKTCQSKFRLQY